MEIDAQLSGYTTAAWEQVIRELQDADFARKLIVRYIVLPNYEERVRFRLIRNDGRPSLLCGMSIEQFNDCRADHLREIIQDAADTYLRGYAVPLSLERQNALGKLLSDAWVDWEPIVFSMLPFDQTQMHVMDIIDDLSRLLEGTIEDQEIADYLRYASLSDIRQAVAPYFPEDVYTVSRP